MCSFLFSSCEKEELVDLIVNGNVEKGITDPDEWWSVDLGDKYNTEWSSTEYFSPRRSLTISIENADSVDNAFWGQGIHDNIPHGKAVTLKVKIKAELEGTGVYLAIFGNDIDEPSANVEQIVSTQNNSPISGSLNWTEYSLTLDKVDATTDRLVVLLVYESNTTGEVYFDDISLTYIK